MLRASPWFLFCALGVAGCRTDAPDPLPEHDREGRALEATLEQLYRAFGFEAGGEADWQAIREASAEGAVFVAPIAAGTVPRAVGVEEFLREFRAYVASDPVRGTGLHEEIVNAQVERFGTIAHAWVVFDASAPGSDARPRRGLDSIELVLAGEHWKVVSFTTQYASATTPLPERFLDDARRPQRRPEIRASSESPPSE